MATWAAQPPATASNGKANVSQTDTAKALQLLTDGDVLTPPKYPASALAEKLGGDVVLHVEVLPDGSVGEIQVASSTPPGRFEAATIDAARHWKFDTNRKDFKSLVGWVRIPVNFDPEGEPDNTNEGA